MIAISREATDSDVWVCLCSNTAGEDGFFPCDADGRQVQPTTTEWTSDCFVCARCGRIIQQHSLEVVGRASAAVAREPS
jgi:Fe2+ or Zn2+ uptake regulation protein